ncbi:MAG: hypothetical protein A3K41_06500 [Chloroflexi bacterium RIFOXYD12_FULL_57_15]|nr:MAG: hypothetical protein A3K41_06500 [Chloroflexi bacterium RIFOXYD12_FULL_57_15]
MILACLKRSVETGVDDVIEEGGRVEDDARGLEALRDGEGRLAVVDRENLPRSGRGRGEQAVVPEQAQGILELLAEAQTWRGSTVEALDLYGNVGEEKQEQAEEGEGEEDERQAAHFDLRF